MARAASHSHRVVAASLPIKCPDRDISPGGGVRATHSTQWVTGFAGTPARTRACFDAARQNPPAFALRAAAGELSTNQPACVNSFARSMSAFRIVLLLFYAAASVRGAENVILSEFMAANSTTLA